MNKVKIFTITHRQYWFPKDSLYETLQVGNGNDLGILRDNTKDNIAYKNSSYCELTGLYWIWKNNSNYDYIGLDHYRRHFTLKHIIFNKKDAVLTYNQLEKILDNTIILPKKRHYYIETIYSQYAHAHNKRDLDITRDIISKYHKEYLESFDKQMHRRSLHICNMFIMPKKIFDEYCTWLFDILFKLEESVDTSDYSSYNKRVVGFVAERLLDVYIEANNLKYKEISYVFMEKQNWFDKIFKFINRKVRSK